MGLNARDRQMIHDEVFGRSDYEPIVTFYDHAAYDEALSEESGRPRFTEQTYTLLKPTHPDLRVRDEVSHPTKDEEIQMYPRQWAAYQKSKQDEIEFKVPLQAIPGMKRSVYEELIALEIHDAESLAEYSGDLGEIGYLRNLSKRIMELSNEARDIREGRQTMGEADHRQHDYSSQVPGRFAGEIKAERTQTEETRKKESPQEKREQEKNNEEVTTFTYQLQVT